MIQYQNILQHILDNGELRNDRTGVGTLGVFGYQMRFNLQEGFPATTTKKLAFKAALSELLWFLEGSTDERRLCEILHGTRDPSKRTIWTDNAQAAYWKPKAKFDGDLGPVYGKQWRAFPSPAGEPVDQIATLIHNLKTDPFSRRHILSAWNPGELNQMALPPCHMFAQFFVKPLPENSTHAMSLSCQLYQRSVDGFLGLPFNLASYSMLTHMIAQVCGFAVGEFIWTGGDCHLYVNHLEQAQEQLKRTPYKLPTLWVNPAVKSIDDFTMDDIKLVNYQSHAAITAPMAV